MKKGSAINREANKYIHQTIEENGTVTVAGVSEIIRPLYDFDPVLAKRREIERIARRALRGFYGDNGERNLLAIKGLPGTYADVERCKSTAILERIDAQLTEKWNGIGKTLDKVKRRRAELEGQTSLFDTTQEAHIQATNKDTGRSGCGTPC